MIRKIYQKLELHALTVIIMALLSLASLLSRRRFTHQNGLTTAGRLRIVDNPQFPDHDFFRPGREFGCRLRHATLLFHDDTILGIRSASIKFADNDLDSPFDLLMNSGTISLFWNAWTFTQFLWGGIKGRGVHWLPYLRKYPQALAGTSDSVRRAPESFAKVYYYSKTVFGFEGRDGKTHYAKYRLIPDDRGPESGIPSAKELETPWIQDPLPGETRSRNYLKEEFKERVEREGVRYHLQIQLYERKDGDAEEVANSNLVWDEQTHPWMDLAQVELDRVLSYQAGNQMRFQLSNYPPSLPVPSAKSIHDYHSINHLRYHSNMPRRMRLLSYRLFGMPKPIPDQRETLEQS